MVDGAVPCLHVLYPYSSKVDGLVPEPGRLCCIASVHTRFLSPADA